MIVQELIKLLEKQHPRAQVTVTLNGCSYTKLSRAEIGSSTFCKERDGAGEYSSVVINLTERHKKSLINLANNIGRE